MPEGYLQRLTLKKQVIINPLSGMKDTKAESQMALQKKQEEERRLAAEKVAREQALKKAMDGINPDDLFRTAK